jgi:butyryl-CoA dehydrogenase
LLLEVLTPIAKSWPSEWCLEANSLAIQVHGGYGSTRDFPVEQYWRDNRLNMIHEGTHGIQAMDLLGRKVLMEQGKGLHLWVAKVHATIAQVRELGNKPSPAASSLTANMDLLAYADQLDAALTHLLQATKDAWATGNPAQALVNAVPYMQAFGHTVLAWLWLDVSCSIQASVATNGEALSAAHTGRLFATAYFFEYELPKITAWLRVVEQRTPVCALMPEAAF